MKKSKCIEVKLMFVLKQVELGTPISEVCRKLGIAEQTFLPLSVCLARSCKEMASRLLHSLLSRRRWLLLLLSEQHLANRISCRIISLF